MGRRRSAVVYDRGGVTVVDLGPMEIWDGADLSLLRDTLTELCSDKGCCSLGIDMTYVKYVPSGFFGMLGDWERKGVSIRLYSPQPRIQNMIWFQQFLDEESDQCYRLLSEPKRPVLPAQPSSWQHAATRSIDNDSKSPAESRRRVLTT